jgi:hypothetical protein
VGTASVGLAVIPDRPPLELDKLPPYHDVAPNPGAYYTAFHLSAPRRGETRLGLIGGRRVALRSVVVRHAAGRPLLDSGAGGGEGCQLAWNFTYLGWAVPLDVYVSLMAVAGGGRGGRAAPG